MFFFDLLLFVLVLPFIASQRFLLLFLLPSSFALVLLFLAFLLPFFTFLLLVFLRIVSLFQLILLSMAFVAVTFEVAFQALSVPCFSGFLYFPYSSC